MLLLHISVLMLVSFSDSQTPVQREEGLVITVQNFQAPEEFGGSNLIGQLSCICKNLIVFFFTINLSCSLQMSEPIWCKTQLIANDNVLRMWKILSCSSLPHGNELCSPIWIEITNCQRFWQFLFWQQVLSLITAKTKWLFNHSMVTLVADKLKKHW